jgi:glycosyltransferase involved in cell wall biosynthesis
MKVAELIANARVVSAGRARFRPKVSLVTPTYCRNAEGLLLRCLDSAYVQSLEDFEHIIIDDGSSDGSEAILTDAAERDDRIVYIRHDSNCGLPAVRTNEGIMRARGEAVAFLFDDNILECDFLEKTWEALHATGADVVLTNVKMMVKDGTPFILGNWPQSIELIRNLNTIPNGGVLVRRTFFERFGLYDPHLMLRRVCDWDLWLRAMRCGAKFVHLDSIGAVEFGLASPNSVGNTIPWDVKIVYGYMQDDRLYAQRNESLLPANISEVDVLDLEPFFAYIRNPGELDEVIQTVYDPFLARLNKPGAKFSLSNRAVAEKILPWFTQAATVPKRHRVLVISNAVTAWVTFCINVLRNDPDFIVINAPEWNLAAFKPCVVDLLILFDSAFEPGVSLVQAFRDAGVSVVYAAQHGFSAPQTDSDHSSFELGFYKDNEGIAALLGTTFYFGQPQCYFSAEQEEVAKRIAEEASFIIGLEQAPHELLSSRGKNWPRLPALTWEDGDRDSVITQEERSPTNVLVQTRCDLTLAVDRAVFDRLPALERFAAAMIAADNGVRLVSTDGKQLTFDRAAGALVTAWICDYAKISTMARGNPNLTAAVFLNSEMISGSEVYGIKIAQHMKSLGMDVQVFVPEQNLYHPDSGLDKIDAWLAQHGLRPAEKARYEVGSQILRYEPREQRLQSESINAFLNQRKFTYVVCAGFMPVFALAKKRNYFLYFALFQVSSYAIADLLAIRESIDGLLSDSEWSWKYLSAIVQKPARVIRTSLPLEVEGDAAVSREPGARVRVAIGGTLQPRKRQLEAVVAIALLREEGIDVDLNIYGYELPSLGHYLAEIDASTKRLGVQDRVRRHGVVGMAEIAANNDIILSAAIDESMPQTLLELIRMGLIGAAVLSGGIDEILCVGETGYLTHDASAAAIAKMLREAIRDQENWPRLRSATQLLLTKDYSNEAVRSALAALLLEAAAANPALTRIEV